MSCALPSNSGQVLQDRDRPFTEPAISSAFCTHRQFRGRGSCSECRAFRSRAPCWTHELCTPPVMPTFSSRTCGSAGSGWSGRRQIHSGATCGKRLVRCCLRAARRKSRGASEAACHVVVALDWRSAANAFGVTDPIKTGQRVETEIVRNLNQADIRERILTYG